VSSIKKRRERGMMKGWTNKGDGITIGERSWYGNNYTKG
jgi:hypothetical protein